MNRNFKKGGGMPPLRSLRELADEFGVPLLSLASKLGGRRDAPKPEFVCKNINQKNSYYEPRAFRKWWKKINDQSNNS